VLCYAVAEIETQEVWSGTGALCMESIVFIRIYVSSFDLGYGAFRDRIEFLAMIAQICLIRILEL
jgi:hypothetical protein